MCGLPLLEALDAALPVKTKLMVLVKSELERSALDLASWRRTLVVRTLGAERNLGAKLRTPWKALAIRLWRPDVLLLAHAADSRPAALFARAVGARLSVGPEGRWSKAYDRRVEIGEFEHKAPYFRRFAEVAGLAPRAPARFPALVAELRADQSPASVTTVCFAPGSGEIERHKRWPTAHYARLAERLIDRGGVRVVALGSHGELPLLRDIHSHMRNPADLEVRPVRTLAESVATLSEAAVVVTGCSGSSHLAAFVGRPIVGLFGPTNPVWTGPYAEKLHVVRRGYACSPCYRDGFTTGCGEPACMSDITPEQVEEAVLARLNGASTPQPMRLRTTGATGPDRRVLQR